MGEVDRQRISAVRVLEGLGYTYRDGEGWQPPRPESAWREANELHTLLIKRADRLAGVFSGTRDATEHRTIIKALEAYEAKRWPDGKIPEGRDERRP